MTDRIIDQSIEVPGTPEEVWEAIATGPGISSWYAPYQVDGAVGGKVRMDWGELGASDGTVTEWAPPHRFAYRSDGDRSIAHEWLIEAKDGDTCVVRIVNRGFGPGEDWDGDYDGMTGGWGILLGNLRLHLQAFRGRHAVPTIPTVFMPGPHADAWRRLCTAIDVAPDLEAGAPFAAGPLRGTIQSTIRRDQPAVTEYLVLLDGGTAFVCVEGDGETVAASGYVYLYGDDAAATGQRWADWFKAALT
jgi:uncharacterized protein YndB with AHSA1/START domain